VSPINTKMPSLIDLPEADVKLWFAKHLAYKNAKDKNRAKLFLDFLIYTYKKVGVQLTMAMIEKETKTDAMNRALTLTIVMNWANKPDYE